MEVFLSWSGRRSEAVARALNDWLPLVLQQVTPFMSRDIEKGSKWDDVISERLESCNFGVICLTRESLGSDWVLFEAGALSKKVRESRVCTYLYDLLPGDVSGPLARFQHTKADHADTKLLLAMLNRHLAAPLDATRFDQTFEHWWPNLKQRLDNISGIDPAENLPRREPAEKLEEILVEVRALRRASEERTPTLYPSSTDALREQRAHASAKWRKFRAAVVAELGVPPDMEILSEVPGRPGAKNVGQMFDVLAVIAGQRIGIDIHVAAQFAGSHLFPEFASTHALRFAEALNGNVCDLLVIATDIDLSAAPPFVNLWQLLRSTGIDDAVRLVFGTPQEIVAALRSV